MNMNIKMKKGTLYHIRTNIRWGCRNSFRGKFVEENQSGYFFDTGYGTVHIEKANWITMKVWEVREDERKY